MSPALLERDTELAEIAHILGAAEHGDGGVLLYESPAGMGKSALLDAAAALAPGPHVLRGAGGEVQSRLGFGLARDMLEPLLRDAGPATRRRWLAGAAAPAGAVLGTPSAAPIDEPAVAHGLYWLLCTVAADAPVLLVADDLQWSDAASVRWLAHLAARLDGLPVAILGATRPATPGEPGAVERLCAVPGVRTRRLAPLSIDATRRLVSDAASGEPAHRFAEACQEVAGGNPFLIGELLETARAEGWAFDDPGARRILELTGPRLRRAVLGRLGRLGPGPGALARSVAVLGDGCDLAVAGALAGLAPAEALAAVPPLVAAGVLADDRRLAFVHALLRTAIHLDIAGPVRASEHGRAAVLLREAGAAPEVVARHLLEAGPAGEDWAPAALGRAAADAIARGAPEHAAAYLRAALAGDSGPALRAELTRALGNALARLGDPAAAQVLGDALALAATPEERAQIVDESVDPLVAGGHPREARRLLLDALGEPAAGEVRTRLAGKLVMLSALDGTGAPGDGVAGLRARADALDLATAAGRSATGALALLAAVCDGTAADASELAHRAVAEATYEGDAREGRPMYNALAGLALAGEPEAAVHRAGVALELSRERGSLLGQGLGFSWRAMFHVLAGAVDAAENDARLSLQIVAGPSPTEPGAGTLTALAWALLERGELAEAESLLAAAPDSEGWGGAALRCARARVNLAHQDHRAARAELAHVEARAAEAGWRSGGVLPWRELAALAARAAGDGEAARALAAAELAEAERFGSAREIGRALHLAGLVTGGADGRERLVAAVATLRDAGTSLALAHALTDLGAALRRDGERAAARVPLAEGLELAYGQGATALVERARIELRAAGARPRSAVRTGVDALTPSEHRVATLAAAGLTNAQIAQELFVTVRTVEMHLTACYRKLEVASRGALPDVLAPG